MNRRDALRLAGGGAVALVLAGCREPANSILVGSKNFTEQIILGELLAQQIEAHTSLRGDRRFDLGGTFLCHQALLSGQLDLYPEYTGTALTAILKEPPANDPGAVYQTVRDAYRTRFQLEVGPPLGFNNTFAIVVRGEDARTLNLRTVSDMVPQAPKWRAGFGYEFMERPDGYKGLSASYGLRFAEPPRVMDLGLLTRALVQRQVDLIAGNNTDGLIPALGLFVLQDDHHYFPPYEAVAVMREEMLKVHPEVKSALDLLAGQISDDDMRRMNYTVDRQHRDPSAVVRDFLAERKLLRSN
jgi:glycine betaine/choline ABC-type transport system substrate-binding protein